MSKKSRITEDPGRTHYYSRPHFTFPIRLHWTSIIRKRVLLRFWLPAMLCAAFIALFLVRDKIPHHLLESTTPALPQNDIIKLQLPVPDRPMEIQKFTAHLQCISDSLHVDAKQQKDPYILARYTDFIKYKEELIDSLFQNVAVEYQTSPGSPEDAAAFNKKAARLVTRLESRAFQYSIALPNGCYPSKANK